MNGRSTTGSGSSEAIPRPINLTYVTPSISTPCTFRRAGDCSQTQMPRCPVIIVNEAFVPATLAGTGIRSTQILSNGARTIVGVVGRHSDQEAFGTRPVGAAPAAYVLPRR